MASRDEEKVESGFNVLPESKPKKEYWILLSIRIITFLATASATIVMALNKQTKNFVVATVGSIPVTVPLVAKFQHTPAFIFFVVANGIVSFHNLVMIAMDILGPKFDNKGLQLALIAVLDTMALALASAGDGAATSMSELGRNGNSHAKWNKICDKFETYCNRGGGALIASFIGLILLLIVTVMSINKLLKLTRN
ncbi:CASP-like protein 1B1 [Vicia villosa]|uniref:CASP-like protein 1B1 n=1 Tax=Vicia villosa TaxID=3911 RepID=UPI00273AB648|nr:CASP-like protein 1B1 [Vicia villosa]